MNKAIIIQKGSYEKQSDQIVRLLTSQQCGQKIIPPPKSLHFLLTSRNILSCFHLNAILLF